MQIIISGIPIDVQKKNIKNMHLYVKPPDGHVIISAPQTMDDKAIEIYARTNLTVNSTIAHECYHWYRHQPYHALMKMIGAKDDVGKVIRCAIQPNGKDTEKWKAVDWLEWQANGVAMHILMPVQTCKLTIDRLMREHLDNADPAFKPHALETVIDELAQYYGVSRQAAKTRMRQLGYNDVDGVYTYVNGHYIENCRRH